jgi:high-affinity nickel permease
MPEITTSKLLKGGAYGAGGGLAGFLFGLGIQAVSQAAGLAGVATVPVTAITPVFTILSIVLGFAHGLAEEE